MVSCFHRGNIWTPVFTGVAALELFTRTSNLQGSILIFGNWCLLGMGCLEFRVGVVYCLTLIRVKIPVSPKIQVGDQAASSGGRIPNRPIEIKT
jgi:hypothetical protein